SESAPARRLDPYQVSRFECARDLRGKLDTVQEVSSRRARASSPRALRRPSATLREDREPAWLEHPELADDTVSAAKAAGTPGAKTQEVPLDTHRISELQRLDRRVEGIRHRHVDSRRAYSVSTGALAAADRLVVGEASVAERDVVHR